MNSSNGFAQLQARQDSKILVPRNDLILLAKKAEKYDLVNSERISLIVQITSASDSIKKLKETIRDIQKDLTNATIEAKENITSRNKWKAITLGIITLLVGFAILTQTRFYKIFFK